MAGTPRSLLSKIRIGAWIAVGIAVVAAIAVYLGNVQQANHQSARISIGGPFELVSHTGDAFSSDTLKGRPYLMFFGFTHCPDICPTTLQELSTHLNGLGPRADEITPLFVTVDPERDTAENMKSYLTSFDPRIIGLTGTKEQIARVAKLYRAFFEKVEGEDGGYSMNHTASVLLFDRQGQLVSTLNWEEKPKVRQAKLEKLLTR